MSEEERPLEGRKHPSELQPGEELTPCEFVVSPQMVNFFLIGIDDRSPWYRTSSPFGAPIMPPVMIHMGSTRLRAWHLWGDYLGAVLVKPSGVHTVFDVENIDPVRIGEKVTMRGKVIQNYIKRGRRYLDYEMTMFGEDGRLCHRYISTTMYGYGEKEES